MKTINPDEKDTIRIPKYSAFAVDPDLKDTMSFCSRCGKWHPDNTLTLCKLLDAKESLYPDKTKKIEAPNAPRGWKKL
jgi:hypothetical protein